MNEFNPFQSPQQVETVVPEYGATSGFQSDETCGDNYSQGWKMMQANFGILLGVSVLYAVIKLPGENLDDIIGLLGLDVPRWVFLLAIPYAIFIALPVWAGTIWAFLKGARQQPVELADMFVVFSQGYWSVLGAIFLKGVILGLGFLALVIPGIILACRLVFVEYLVIDRKMSPFEAIQESWKMTQGHAMTIFLMWLLAIPIMIVGFLLCIVGSIPAGMWISSAFAVLYHTCTARQAASNREAVEASSTMPEAGAGFSFD